MSRNSPETGVQVLNTIRRDGLDISRFAFTGGKAPADYLDAFNVDLFLTANVEDAQCVTDSRSCAVAVLRKPPENGQEIPDSQVRLAFDGDAVLFPEDSELVFKTEGLRAFQKLENDKQDVPLAGALCHITEKTGSAAKQAGADAQGFFCQDCSGDFT